MATETFIEPSSKEIMQVLITRRKALGLTANEIATRTFSSVALIEQLESGIKPLSLDDLCKYAYAVDALLNVNVVTDVGSQRKRKA